MDCPFCGKEMKEGRIPANQQLKWYDNTVDTVMGEGVPLSGRFRTAEAYYCPDCRQIILPVPEVESVLEMMERKLSAVGGKLEAAQKQWETRKSQTKEQKKKKDFESKDPWEL